MWKNAIDSGSPPCSPQIPSHERAHDLDLVLVGDQWDHHLGMGSLVDRLGRTDSVSIAINAPVTAGTPIPWATSAACEALPPSEVRIPLAA
jgi:hypothetical protein